MRTLHVVGAGTFGSALAYTWSKAGRDVVLWCRDPQQAAALASTGQNDKVPGCPALVDLRSGVLADFGGLEPDDALVLAVKAQAQRPVFAAIAPELGPENQVISAAKGFANDAGELLSEGLRPAPATGLAILSGPSFAQDLFLDRPTALTLALTSEAAETAPAKALIDWLSTPSLRLYSSQDPVGLQVCGAMKNIIAIACGCAEGMGLGASARTALMTRGLREIERVIRAYGGDPKTAAGLAGVGDLALTCQDRQSRNFSFGFDLGRGQGQGQGQGKGQSAQALLASGTTVEGASAALNLQGSARVSGLDLPIATAVAALVRGDEAPAALVQLLLARQLSTDV